MASASLSFQRPSRIQQWLDRLEGDNLDPLEDLRRETWRSITRTLGALPAARFNVFTSSVLSNLIDTAPKECLVALLLCVDLAATELAEAELGASIR